MKTLKITILFLLIGLAGMSQTKKRLVADETTITELKASIKVETSNEVIFKSLLAKFKPSIKKYTVEFKQDRSGEYKQYVIPFKNEQLPEVEQFLKSI